MENVVYVLTLVDSGLFYIGSTSNLKKRIKQHLEKLNAGNHGNIILQKHWALNQEILVNSIACNDRQSAYDLEEKMILQVSKSNRSYLMANIGLGSFGGDNYTRHPHKNEVIRYRVQRQVEMNSRLSPEERSKRFDKRGPKNGMFGRTHTPEVRLRLSEIAKKRPPPTLGKKLSAEHVDKIRQRQRLRTGSKNSFFGKTHSVETREKLRLINLGRKGTNVKKVSVDGVIYDSCQQAADTFKISLSLLGHRLRSKNYPSWFYVNK